MVLVHVRLYSGLSRFVNGNREHLQVELPKNATVRQLFEHLSIPEEKVGVVSLNQSLADPDTILNDGDRLDLVSPIGGGSQ